MASIPFYIANVFAEQRYLGNQIVVLIVKEALPDKEMLKICREFQYQEAIFIQFVNGQYHVRYFTVVLEIPYSGHPSLAATYVLQQEIIKEKISSLSLNYPLNKNTTDIQYNEDGSINNLWMEIESAPNFLRIHDKHILANLLGIPKEAISPDLPIYEVAARIPYLIIPLVDPSYLKAIKINPLDFKAYLISENCHITNNPYKISSCFYPYAPIANHPTYDYQSRMFALGYNKLYEHSGTASANSALLAYLLKHHVQDIEATVRQGVEIKRNATIYIKGKKENEKYQLRVGGKVQLMAKGELAL